MTGYVLRGKFDMVSLSSQMNMAVAEQYFSEHFRLDDYHNEQETVMGLWVGSGAKRLGLEGMIDKEDYRAVLHQELGRFGQAGRPRQSEVIYYELTFNMPKSVSLVAMRDERVKSLVLDCVKDHIPRMEEWARVRDRRGDKWQSEETRSTGNLVGALFVHESSRALDPDLHVHVVIPNMSYDSERRQWLALQASALYENQKLSDMAVLNDVAKGLLQLGYEIERTVDGFEIRGFERETLDKFSQRSRAIKEKLAEWEANPAELARVAGIHRLSANSLTDADRRQLAALETRPRKQVVRRADLVRGMMERFAPEERRQFEQILQTAQQSPVLAPEPSISEWRAMNQALSDHFERASVAKENELLAKALAHGIGHVDYKQVQRQLHRKELIREGDYLTTREVLAEESRIIDFVRDGRGSCVQLGVGDVSINDKKLSGEQVAAVRHVLTSRDRVIGIRGAAGTGKTTMMREAVRSVEASGRSVFVVAPSASASRGTLRQEGFAQADTLAQLLVNASMQEKIKGQVIWVDEAGLVSARQMRQLFDLAARQEARVILSGDIHQHGAVERGDALRLLEQYGGLKSVELTSIHRQKNQIYKEAVQALDAGDTGAAFEKLDSLNAIREIPDAERYQCLADDYVSHRQHKQSVLVVSPIHAEGERVTEAIRSKLKEKGVLSKEQSIGSLRNLNWTETQRGEAHRYQPQQVIQFHQNTPGFRKGEKVTVLAREGTAITVRDEAGNVKALDLRQAKHFQVFDPKTVPIGRGDMIRFSQNGFTADGKHRLQNGDIRQVKGFTRSGDIRLNNGWVVSRSFGHIQHGYAVTSHASQGKTVDHVLVAINSRSAMTTGSSEQAYVSISRGRQSVTIYTDCKAAVMEAAKISSARPSGHDLVAKLPVHKISRASIKTAVRIQQAAIDKIVRQERPEREKEAKQMEKNKQQRLTPSTPMQQQMREALTVPSNLTRARPQIAPSPRQSQGMHL